MIDLHYQSKCEDAELEAALQAKSTGESKILIMCCTCVPSATKHIDPHRTKVIQTLKTALLIPDKPRKRGLLEFWGAHGDYAE